MLAIIIRENVPVRQTRFISSYTAPGKSTYSMTMKEMLSENISLIDHRIGTCFISKTIKFFSILWNTNINFPSQNISN